ncbi:MAG: FtsH protease activity modulator HflK [Bacteroidaceae bacterium]|nr:FtsH protease activity modulator HflK [Bacteroidaceae bacterium]
MYRDNYRDKEVSKVVRIIWLVVIAILALIMVFTSIYTINEDQDAVLTTFGQPSVVSDSGMHFKLPFGIQKVKKVDMSVRGMAIGYDANGNSIENESLMITNDFNFVSVDFYLEWQVTDAVAYLYAAQDPELMVKTLAMSFIRDTVGSYSVDEVLTTGKAQIQTEIKEKLMERLAAENIGVTIRSVAIQDAEPPTAEVANAFKAVEDAKQNAETVVNGATAYKNQKLPAAEAQVKSIVEKATADKAARIAEAQGQIARFNAMYAEYIKFPGITMERMYYEAMEELLPGITVIVQDEDGTIVNILDKDEKGGE